MNLKLLDPSKRLDLATQIVAGLLASGHYTATEEALTGRPCIKDQRYLVKDVMLLLGDLSKAVGD